VVLAEFHHELLKQEEGFAGPPEHEDVVVADVAAVNFSRVIQDVADPVHLDRDAVKGMEASGNNALLPPPHTTHT
jgi:hypothetical protein